MFSTKRQGTSQLMVWYVSKWCSELSSLNCLCGVKSIIRAIT